MPLPAKFFFFLNLHHFFIHIWIFGCAYLKLVGFICSNVIMCASNISFCSYFLNFDHSFKMSNNTGKELPVNIKQDVFYNWLWQLFQQISQKQTLFPKCKLIIHNIFNISAEQILQFKFPNSAINLQSLTSFIRINKIFVHKIRLF
jgi:hypothetical protein